MKWPGGATSAFTFSFHFDAETLWTSRDPANAKRPVLLSQGRYGAKVGVDLVLRMLGQRGVRATFFVPGLVVETHPVVVRRIIDAGHEIGHHGYAHEHLDPDDPEDEQRILAAGIEAIESIAGVRPVGYCSPAWEITPATLTLLVREGFAYSTNFMDDIEPYLHDTADVGRPLVEVPVSWTLDDAPFRLFSTASPRPIRSARAIAEIWSEEAAAIAARGGLVNLTLHPQVTGRPAMLDMFDSLLADALADPSVFVGSLGQIATWAKDRLLEGGASRPETNEPDGA